MTTNEVQTAQKIIYAWNNFNDRERIIWLLSFLNEAKTVADLKEKINDVHKILDVLAE